MAAYENFTAENFRNSSTKLEQIESLEQLRWLENGYKIQLVETTLEADSIDTPEDLERLLKKYF